MINSRTARSSRTQNCVLLTPDSISPMFPKPPLERPRFKDDRCFPLSVYRKEPDFWSEPLQAVFNLEPALLLGAYRAVFGCLPDTDANGETVLYEAELRDLAQALWPEVRSAAFRRRCAATKHLQRLRSLGSA
jgi:hypothetical protein